jgi:hypothetical protein
MSPYCFRFYTGPSSEAESKEKHGEWDQWAMGPYAGVDYNLTLCPLQSRLQLIYHGQPMPESTLTLCQSQVDFIPISGTLDLASESSFYYDSMDQRVLNDL